MIAAVPRRLDSKLPPAGPPAAQAGNSVLIKK
jgi:hypothetical protein